ncbi:MAG TPA: hypothetical protein VFS05_08680 [Gemmatimonadaceae bacterium]|nr:hypothetical protein [Gemmatimonadaceae bacterium]
MLAIIPTAIRPRTLTAALAAVALLALAACNRGSEESGGTPLSQQSAGTAQGELPPNHPPLGETMPASDLPPAARAALDSGNAAFREKAYDKALAYYRNGVKAAPDHSAPYFGVYMAAKAMGNLVLADSAMAQVKAHAKGATAMSDSALKEMHAKVQAVPKSE